MAHLSSGSLARAFACTDCHNPPTSTTHASGRGRVQLQRAGRRQRRRLRPGDGHLLQHLLPRQLRGRQHGQPAGVDGRQRGRGLRHLPRVPPRAPHTQSTACGSCHPGYTGTSVNLTTHVNGIRGRGRAHLHVLPRHGQRERGAPRRHPGSQRHHAGLGGRPPDARDDHPHGRARGLHRVPRRGLGQLRNGPLRRHRPGRVRPQGQPGHARRRGTGPPARRATATAGRPRSAGGTGDRARCGPGSTGPSRPARAATARRLRLPHVQNTACGSCHSGYTSTTVAAASHINGAVDVRPRPHQLQRLPRRPSGHAGPPHRRRASPPAPAATTRPWTRRATSSPAESTERRPSTLSAGDELRLVPRHRRPHANPTSFSDEVEAAPPRDLSGNTSPSRPGRRGPPRPRERPAVEEPALQRLPRRLVGHDRALLPRQRHGRHGLGHARDPRRRHADLRPRIGQLLQLHLLPRQLPRRQRRRRLPGLDHVRDARLLVVPRRASRR